VLSIDLDIGNVVLENGWDIDLCARLISLTSQQIYSFFVVVVKLSWNRGRAVVKVAADCRFRIIKRG
jgi:hypothetical protein